MTLNIQKANFWKRLSAWLVDTVLVLVLSMSLSLPVLRILDFDYYSTRLTAIHTMHKETVESQFSVDLDISKEDYEKLPEVQKTVYQDAQRALAEALGKDKEYITLRADRMSVVVTDACIVLFASILLAHFVLPLILKNGQTLGKKVFGLAVVRSNCVKVSPTALFLRSIVGLFAIETMAVSFFLMIYPVGVVAAVLVQVLQIFVMVKTPNNCCIHDLLSDTIVVDFASQRIFETNEEFLEYVKAEKAREAAETAY